MTKRGRYGIDLLGDAKGAKKAFREVRDESDGLVGHMKGLNGKLAGALKAGLAGAGVAAGAALTKGFMDGLDQGALTDQMSASLGLSPAESAELGKISGQLYADAYGDSFGTVTDAVAAVRGELGAMDGDQLKGLTANALDFATAFQQDVNASVGAAGILLRNGLVKDGEEAFDILTVAMQKVPPAVRDEVLAATQEYSTFFADLGITGSDAFALIAESAQKGGNYGVDKVGDALKELTIRGTDMSEASVKAFEAAGLNAQEMAWKFLQGGDTARGALDELVGGLQGIEGDVARSNAAIALFGTPLEDLSTAEIPQFLDMLAGMGGGLGDVEGAADRMGDTLNDNLKTKIEGWKRKGLQAMTDLMMDKVIPAVEDFAPVVQDVFGTAADVVGDVASDIDGWLDDNAETIEALGDTVDDVIGSVIGWFRDARDDIGDSTSELGKIVQQLRDLVATYLEAIQVYVETLVKVATALWQRFGDDLIEYARESWDNIQEILRGALDFITGLINIFIAVFTGDWGRLWDGIKQTVSGAWQVIRGIVEQALNVLDTILSVAMGTLAEIWSLAWNGMKTLLSDIFEGAGGIVAKIGGWVGDIVDFFTDLPGEIAGAAASAFGALLEAVKTVIRSIINAWNSLDLEFTVPDVPGVPGRGDRFDLIPDVGMPSSLNPSSSGAPGGRRTSTGRLGGVPLANGGVLDRPTLALIAEYPGAHSDPEIVTPESLMRKVFREESVGRAGIVHETKIYTSHDPAEIARRNAHEQRLVQLASM